MRSRAGKEPEVRISELAEAAEVPVATVKYYLREGLLPPGRATAPNQAIYDIPHLRRLRLIRVLREVGGLSIAAIGQVVAVIDDPRRPLHQVLGAAHRAISPAPPPQDASGPPESGEVDAFLGRLGWKVSRQAPDRRELAGALAALRRLGYDVDVEAFLPYARAVEPIAGREVAGLPPGASRDEAVEYVVVGTVVYGQAMAALRRLAQEHHSAQRNT